MEVKKDEITQEQWEEMKKIETVLKICVGIIISPFLLAFGVGWLINKAMKFVLPSWW